MEVGRLMTRVCTILIPTWVSEPVRKLLMVSRIDKRPYPGIEEVVNNVLDINKNTCKKEINKKLVVEWGKMLQNVQWYEKEIPSSL